MKKLTMLFTVALLFAAAAFAQQRESGQNLGAHPYIVDAPENIQWLYKQAARQTALDFKSIYFYEGFEEPTEGGALPNGWIHKRTTTPDDDPIEDAVAPRWFRNSASYGFANWNDYVYSGAASMAIGYTAPDFTWAISPEFHIADTEGDVNLTYWVWTMNSEASGWLTSYYVRVKSEGEWFTLLSYSGTNDNINEFDEQIVIGLNAFKGQDVQLAFVYEYTDGYQMAIDDIVVGETLYDDFGITSLSVFPTFGLLPGHHVDISAFVFCNGPNPGTVEVSLLANGEVVDTHTTGWLTQDGPQEYVAFTWEAPAPGHYELMLQLPDDDNLGNNTLSTEVYVNHYYNMAEHFENFEFDDLGQPELVFPPDGWTLNDPSWVTATLQWPIFDQVSGMLHGRVEQDEKMLVTKAIDLTPQDHWIRFFLEGVNNYVEVTPGDPEGYSTFQLKYSASPGGPWTNLGDPIPFIHTYDDDGNLVVAANGLRHVERDISHLSGTHYFAFTSTSTFDLIIDGTVYRSFVIIDNVMVGGEPGEPSNYNIMKIHDATASTNGIVTVELEIINEDEFVGFNADIPIPVGFTYVPGSAQLHRDNGHFFNFEILTGNVARMISAAIPTTPFLGNDGVIVSFDLQTPGQEGDFSLCVENAVIADENGVNIMTGNICGTITLSENNTVTFNVTNHLGTNIQNAIITLNGVTNPAGNYVFENMEPGTYQYSAEKDCYLVSEGFVVVAGQDVQQDIMLENLPGDANNDGVVNVSDIVIIVNYFMGQSPDPFCFINADVNGDGVINVSDVVGATNIFMGEKASPHDGLESKKAHLYLYPDGIYMESDGTLTAMQFELEGKSLESLSMALILESHQIMYSTTNKELIAMVFSTNNTAIPKGKVKIIDFETGQHQMQWGEVLIANLNADLVNVTTHTGETTAVAQTDDLDNIQVYPNPAKDVLWVEFNNTTGNPVWIALMDIHGRVVQNQTINDPGQVKTPMELGEMPAGTYILRFQSACSHVTKKIIVN